MKKDTREAASFEELQVDAQRHWKDVGRVRDERYPIVKQMLAHPWRCTNCHRSNDSGGICPICREARIVEVE